MAQRGDLVTVIQLAGGRASSRIKFTAHAFLSLEETQLCYCDFSQRHSKIRCMYPPLLCLPFPSVWGLSNVKWNGRTRAIKISINGGPPTVQGVCLAWPSEVSNLPKVSPSFFRCICAHLQGDGLCIRWARTLWDVKITTASFSFFSFFQCY